MEALQVRPILFMEDRLPKKKSFDRSDIFLDMALLKSFGRKITAQAINRTRLWRSN